eukprot:278377-Pleurochrysis_carterae.AAC.1
MEMQKAFRQNETIRFVCGLHGHQIQTKLERVNLIFRASVGYGACKRGLFCACFFPRVREQAAAGEDEDHDTRRLKFPDRMRLVLKNKEEGTELFQGGNFRPAAARYNKALTHAAKFLDLSPDQRTEVRKGSTEEQPA